MTKSHSRLVPVPLLDQPPADASPGDLCYIGALLKVYWPPDWINVVPYDGVDYQPEDDPRFAEHYHRGTSDQG